MGKTAPDKKVDSLTDLLQRRVMYGGKMDSLVEELVKAYEEAVRTQLEILKRLPNVDYDITPPCLLEKVLNARLITRISTAFEKASKRSISEGRTYFLPLVETFKRDKEQIENAVNIPIRPKESHVDYIKRIGVKIHKINEGDIPYE